MDTPPARTDSEYKNLINRLDRLTNDRDRSYIGNIEEYIDGHRTYMNNNYGRFQDQFEMFFGILADYSHNLNYMEKDNWPLNRGMQYVIATKSLKQLYSGYTLLQMGAYEDSVTVLRSAYESFLRIVFISIHPNHAGNAYKAPGQTGPVFNATNLVNKDLRLDWTKYSITSAFAHSNMYEVMGDLIQIGLKKKPKLIILHYQVSEEMIGLITNLMNFLLANLLMQFDQLYKPDISKLKDPSEVEKHMKKLHEYAEILMEALKGHKENEYWRKTAVDIEDIMHLIHVVDADPSLEWKMVWAQIRA